MFVSFYSHYKVVMILRVRLMLVTEVVEGSEGETISEDEAQFRRLEELVKSHDVCFALTDSREARWLPTVLSAAHNKLLINVALGFDTYLVMRHGQEVAPTASSTASAAEGGPALSAAPGASRLGCYFCNDIVAATNSQRDRSLDQQCTVTRPGLSFIAAALGVELMVALMHATETSAGDVSASQGEESEEGSQSGSAAGKVTEAPVIPHQIRGSVAGFTQFTPHVSM
jgi:ubiquitin-like modifier-activating enzyme ATG7